MNSTTISDYMTVKCPICGRPYHIWSTKCGDQSACPICQKEADKVNRIADDYTSTNFNVRKYLSYSIS